MIDSANVTKRASDENRKLLLLRDEVALEREIQKWWPKIRKAIDRAVADGRTRTEIKIKPWFWVRGINDVELRDKIEKILKERGYVTNRPGNHLVKICWEYADEPQSTWNHVEER
jgi:hypothetical protein